MWKMCNMKNMRETHTSPSLHTDGDWVGQLAGEASWRLKESENKGRGGTLKAGKEKKQDEGGGEEREYCSGGPSGPARPSLLA